MKDLQDSIASSPVSREQDDESSSHYLPSPHQHMSPPDRGFRCRVLVNAILSPLQERNLSELLGRHVIDRMGLILRIFANRAKTREAKLQVCESSMS
jgi:hypothetical protein